MSPETLKFLAVSNLVAVDATPVKSPVTDPENVVAVMIPLDIVIAVPTLSVVKVDTPDELISDVITLGSLASLIVPVVILAALDRLVAVVAVPVKLPTKVVAVITPLTRIFPAVIPTPIPVAGFDPICNL